MNLLPIEGIVAEHHPRGTSFKLAGHTDWYKMTGALPRPPVGRHIDGVVDKQGWVRWVKVRGVLAQRLIDANQ